jgi:peptide/nickel transport system permease protein
VVIRIRQDRLTLLCLAIIAFIVLCTLLADLLAPYDPYATSMRVRLRPIGFPGHLLGTDELGRDILSRLLFGGRLTLLMGIAPVVNAFVIGGTLGVCAGYAGGPVNMAIMRVMDVLYAFPSVLLAIAISGTLGAGPLNAIISLTFAFVPPVTRVAESVTTQMRELDFIQAARATGAGAWPILRVHVFSNVLGPILAYATSLISVSIVLAAGLSFLGLGIEPPHAEWGLMLSSLRQSIYANPWVSALPGVMIFLSSICFNLMSDGVRAAIDVRATVS